MNPSHTDISTRLKKLNSFWGGLFLFVWLFSYSHTASAYSDVRCILLLNRYLQSDSIGHNFVKDLSAWAEPRVHSGELKLWDSPAMKRPIQPEELLTWEKGENARLGEAPYLFINERWTLKGERYDFETEGFSFAKKGKGGEDVYFGYLPLDDKLRKLLGEAYLSVNADGNYGATLADALRERQFYFDLVFWNDAALKDPAKAQKLKLEALAALPKAIYPIESKLLTYDITTGPSPQARESERLRAQLQQYLGSNRKLLAELSKGKIANLPPKSKILITDISVRELWTKQGSNITVKPLQLILTVFGQKLEPVSVQKLTSWGVKWGKFGADAYFREKKYYHRIRQVNGTTLEPAQSEAMKMLLESRNWQGLLGRLHGQQP